MTIILDISRLYHSGDLVNEKPIKAAGIAGLMRPEKTKVQLIIGSKVSLVSDALKSLVD